MTIKNAAHQVRNWAEKVANKETYQNIYTEGLHGFCAIASAKLFQALEGVGLRPTLVVTHKEKHGSHVYVHCAGYMIDVTATQFDSNYPHVVMFPLRTLYRWEMDMNDDSHWYWTRIVKKYSSVEALLQAQRKEGWPTEQWCVQEEASDEP